MLMLLLGTATKDHLHFKNQEEGFKYADGELAEKVSLLGTDKNAETSYHGTLDNTVSMRIHPSSDHDAASSDHGTEATAALRGKSAEGRTLQTQDEPPWYFTVSVGIHKPTSDYYGGFEETKKMVEEQFNTVSSRFTGPFNWPIIFDPVNIYEFSTSPLGRDGGVLTDHSDYDYLVVHDGFSTLAGGWYVSYQSIHLSRAVESGGPFDSYATDALIHGFGIARGCLNIYALKVDGDKNPVNRQYYHGDVSVMNNPYGETVWDEHCTTAVNTNGRSKPATIDFIQETWPTFIDFIAVDSNGQGLENVRIQLFRVAWYSKSVDPKREKELLIETDTNGRARWSMLDANMFGPGCSGSNPDGSPCFSAIKTPNFLVEFTLDNDKKRQYEWLPITDVQNFVVNQPGEVFEVLATFESTTVTGPFPKNFKQITCTYASCIGKVLKKIEARTQFVEAQDAYDISLRKTTYSNRLIWKEQKLVRSLKRLKEAMDSIVELRKAAPGFSNGIGRDASTCAIKLVESSINVYKGKGILDDEFLDQVPKQKLAKAKKKRTKKEWNISVSMSLGAIGVMMDELEEIKVPLC